MSGTDSRVAKIFVGTALVVVGQGKLRVLSDGLVIVLNGRLKLAKKVVGEAPVVVGPGKQRV